MTTKSADKRRMGLPSDGSRQPRSRHQPPHPRARRSLVWRRSIGLSVAGQKVRLSRIGWRAEQETEDRLVEVREGRLVGVSVTPLSLVRPSAAYRSSSPDGRNILWTDSLQPGSHGCCRAVPRRARTVGVFARRQVISPYPPHFLIVCKGRGCRRSGAGSQPDKHKTP